MAYSFRQLCLLPIGCLGTKSCFPSIFQTLLAPHSFHTFRSACHLSLLPHSFISPHCPNMGVWHFNPVFSFSSWLPFLHPSPISLQNTALPLSLHPVPLHSPIAPTPRSWCARRSGYTAAFDISSLLFPPLCLHLLCLSVSACLSVCLSFSTGSGMMGLCRKGVLMEPWPSLHYFRTTTSTLPPPYDHSCLPVNDV